VEKSNNEGNGLFTSPKAVVETLLAAQAEGNGEMLVFGKWQGVWCWALRRGKLKYVGFLHTDLAEQQSAGLLNPGSRSQEQSTQSLQAGRQLAYV